MKSDFDLICHEFEQGKDIKIIPIADVHLGASEHMYKEWQQFLDSITGASDTYVAILGDLLNNSTRSSVANVYEEIMRPREQKRIMCDMLEPLRDQILCCVSGNHERRSLKDADDDPTYDIMCKLDLEHLYRQNSAFMKLNFGTSQKMAGSQRPCYTIVCSHGAGGGSIGSAVTRNEKFGYMIDNMDMLITGHTHKPVVTQPAKLVIDTHNNQVKVKPFKCVTATSWLGYGGYALEKMLLPASHCPQIITLSGDHKEIKITM